MITQMKRPAAWSNSVETWEAPCHIPGIQWVAPKKLWQVYHAGAYVGCFSVVPPSGPEVAWQKAVAAKAKEMCLTKGALLNKFMQSQQSVQSTTIMSDVGVAGTPRAYHGTTRVGTKYKAQVRVKGAVKYVGDGWLGTPNNELVFTCHSFSKALLGSDSQFS